MNTPAVVHNTFVIERSYPAPPEKVFAAFADPAKKRRWFAEGHHHDIEQFEMDFREGGIERTNYRLGAGTPFPGTLLTSDASYQDIVPNSRIVMAATMTFGGKKISAALATFEFLPTAQGTDMIFTHQAAFFEGADGPEMRKDGWSKLFGQLEQELAG